ncbi:hypothetical protein ABT297_15495 [Dactylosporangium sp. NPDC000555]|uniref:hypothetical protein n=1 Tax=Dactylosporangium sp. NPDC000555 TaxID=3154260 RepID=UPI00332B8538
MADNSRPEASGEQWRERRARAVAHHGAELERRREAEAAQAMSLIADFVSAARESGPPAAPLRARSYTGRTYRTSLRGWYLDSARTIAISEAGEYYSLLVPPSARSWLTGAAPAPQRPRLIVGEGARDGESMPLATLLQRLLSASTVRVRRSG